MDRFATRRDKIRRFFKKEGLDGLMITNPSNVSYLTGFTGEDAFLLIRSRGECLLTDRRFTTQLEGECPGLDLAVRGPGGTMTNLVAAVLGKAKCRRLGIEADSMSVAVRDQISRDVPEVALAPTSGLVEKLREIKDSDEISRIREAVRYAEKGYWALRSLLRQDKTENELAADLEYQMRQFGAEGPGFPTIVAVGARAALPHARPGGIRVSESDFVLVDWGATARGYRSDLTRLLVTGRISPKLERVYGVVLRAQQAAIKAIRPGALAKDVDYAARHIIAEAGFGSQFGHGLGHGFGLDIHESPRMSAMSQGVLRPGMVITVEPGIYLPGWGGVRIEDDILVTRDGHEVLTSVPRTLEESVVD